MHEVFRQGTKVSCHSTSSSSCGLAPFDICSMPYLRYFGLLSFMFQTLSDNIYCNLSDGSFATEN